MHPGRVSFVLFLIIFHNGFALHYKYDPRWKWKENQFVDLNDDFRVHHSGDVKTTSEISPTPGSTYPPVVKGTSEGTDEDLLDLMVRIAETPSEWEKIHQVLNQLGKSKTKSNVSHDKANDNHKEHLTKSSTSTTPCPTTDKSSTRYETPTTNPTLFDSRAENEINQDREEVTEKETNDEKENPNSKPTWPDIFKNEYEKLFWNAENIYDEEMSDEGDEDEENYFSEYQWDEEDKSVNNNVNSLNSDEDASKASKTNVNRKENRENINISKASRVNNVNNGVNNKYEFVHFLNSAVTSTVRTVVTNVTNHNDVQKDNDDNTGARNDNWPNFSYHRVTVNPKEKFKNLSKAFIVVSEISPKHNETITKTNENSIENHSHETHMKVSQRGEDSVRKELVAESETSLHSRGDTHLKEKIFRHHWRDKPKHSKRRHHRTHSHHVTPSPDY